jgi:hypothetical protein
LFVVLVIFIIFLHFELFQFSRLSLRRQLWRFQRFLASREKDMSSFWKIMTRFYDRATSILSCVKL